MELKDNLTWTDKQGEVTLLGDLQRAWVEAFINKDLKIMQDIVDLFYQQLSSISQLKDEEGFEIRIEDTRRLVYSIDRNQDGKIDYLEKLHCATLFGEAFEKIRKIYLDLCRIKGRIGN